MASNEQKWRREVPAASCLGGEISADLPNDLGRTGHPCTSDICRATVPCRAIVKKFTHASFSRTISSHVNNFLDEKYSIHIAASLHYEL